MFIYIAMSMLKDDCNVDYHESPGYSLRNHDPLTRDLDPSGCIEIMIMTLKRTARDGFFF